MAPLVGAEVATLAVGAVTTIKVGAVVLGLLVGVEFVAVDVGANDAPGFDGADVATGEGALVAPTILGAVAAPGEVGASVCLPVEEGLNVGLNGIPSIVVGMDVGHTSWFTAALLSIFINVPSLDRFRIRNANA